MTKNNASITDKDVITMASLKNWRINAGLIAPATLRTPISFVR
jgi:hypothetical protein